MQTPLVSIIIPTYNRAHLIGETLDSVLAQTYTNWECIVVDDGSTDNTGEILSSYCKKDTRFQYHHRPKDRLPGGNAARNYGFELSIGEYVNWFDSDDLMHKNKLRHQMELLIVSKKSFCVCQTLVFNEKLKNLMGLRKKNIFSKDPLNDFIKAKITWLTQAPIFCKYFLLKENLTFDEKLVKAQEFEFFIRVLNKDCNYVYTNEALVYLRIHSNRISSDNYLPLKSYSVFKASFSSLKLVKDVIHFETKNELLRRMVNQIFLSLQNNNIDIANKMKIEFMEIDLSRKYKAVFELGIYFFFIFGNIKILSFMASKKKKTFKSFLLHKVI